MEFTRQDMDSTPKRLWVPWAGKPYDEFPKSIEFDGLVFVKAGKFRDDIIYTYEPVEMKQYILIRGDLQAGHTAFGLYTQKEVDELEENPGGILAALDSAGWTNGDLVLAVGGIQGFRFYGPFCNINSLHHWRGDRFQHDWAVMSLPGKIPLR